MSEEFSWIGGQLTSQAVPPDEHGWIEQFGCTRNYRRFREGVRAYYRNHYPLRASLRDNARLNPGNGWVSPLCHEPRVALAVLESMLAPYVSNGRVRIWRQHRPVATRANGPDRISAVVVRDVVHGAEVELRAQFFLDFASGPFYGFNRAGAKTSQGVIQNWWRQAMQGGAKAQYDCILPCS